MNKRYDSSKQWYAIHTYSGYEEKVAESIRQRADSLDMADKIYQVVVPKEKQIEIKNGKRKVVEKRIFQGYVLVQMKMSEDAWYIVRNTPNVTGFVGTGTEPTPVSQDEMDKIMKRMGREEPKFKIDLPLVKWSILSTDHSRALMALLAKLTPKKVNSKSWSTCSAAKLPWNLIACR